MILVLVSDISNSSDTVKVCVFISLEWSMYCPFPEYSYSDKYLQVPFGEEMGIVYCIYLIWL